MPLALGVLTFAAGGLASFVPGISIVVRLAVWAAIIAMVAEVYRTTVRRIVLRDDAVDVELSHKKARIPYASLDHVVVRAQRTSLGVTFVVKHPAAVIRTRTGLMPGDVRAIAPRLIRALIVHGVDVRVPGRPDAGTTS